MYLPFWYFFFVLLLHLRWQLVDGSTRQNTLSKKVTKLILCQNSNCDKTPTVESQIVTWFKLCQKPHFLQNPICDHSNCYNSNCNKAQIVRKVKLWPKSNSGKLWNVLVRTTWQLQNMMRWNQGSLLRFRNVFKGILRD